MPRCPIVKPDVVRVSLSEGDFLDLKKRLNTGEYRTMVTAQYQTTSDKLAINLEQMGLSKVMAYVVGWSFVNFDGQPLAFSEGAIRSMDPDVFREVLEAVDAHEDAQDAARVTEKNAKDGASASSAISPSVDA